MQQFAKVSGWQANCYDAGLVPCMQRFAKVSGWQANCYDAGLVPCISGLPRYQDGRLTVMVLD